MDGLLIVDKPVGPTSHDVVARVRVALGEPRVGHTGTLDPAASGVLPLVLGRATRLARFLSAAAKSYDAVIGLGVATDTFDASGRVSGTAHPGPLPDRAAIERALDAFRGTFLQQPPAFSAKKIGGRRSHRIARARQGAPPAQPGAEPAAPTLPAPARVAAYAIEVVGVEAARVHLRIECSAGFYVRSLADDLGRQLGVGGHLVALRRTSSGDFTLDDAVPLETIVRDPAAARAALTPLGRMLPGVSALRLTPEGARRARHGADLGPAHFVAAASEWAPGAGKSGGTARGEGAGAPDGAGACFRLVGPDGELVGLAEPTGTPGLLHPAVVLM
jgi:tRNA pseudouridine55 synthase